MDECQAVDHILIIDCKSKLEKKRIVAACMQQPIPCTITHAAGNSHEA
jgi:hypothetical protein